MEEEILKSIDKKLEAITRLLAGTFVQGKTKAEAIRALGSLGMDTNTIAAIVNTTPATVTARLWEQKKKGAAKKKAQRTKQAEDTNE
jgi:hypothetical protein